MRKGIHPLLRALRIVDTQGGSSLSASVAPPPKGLYFLQHDTTNHPAWTRKKKETSNTGQVAKYNLRFGGALGAPSAPPAAAADPAAAPSASPAPKAPPAKPPRK
jgi:ribosomal protein L31